MPDAKSHITLSKNIGTADDLDFSFLRKEGIAYIERLSNRIWTDYNSHDPGITILEMLAYAITDLGLRASLPIEELTGLTGERAQNDDKHFFTADEILLSSPITGTDYRKLFIDIEGVKNCWVKPYGKNVHADCKNYKLSYNRASLTESSPGVIKTFQLRGLYSILVELEAIDKEKFPTDELEEEESNRILEEVRKVYHAHRNLCEDVILVKPVETHQIVVCAIVEIEPDANEELIQAMIWHGIDQYFSPPIRFYSLSQMLDKGYKTDEIFNGPLLRRGFIDNAELEASDLRTEIRMSDIINIIMEIDGVKLIKEISLNDCDNFDSADKKWVLCINNGQKPIRCKESAFTFYKDVLPVNVNKTQAEIYLKEIEGAEKKEWQNARPDMVPVTPVGNQLNISETTTIQNDFPDAYGIGENGLPKNVGTVRLAKAKQLKAYLLFFDQIFATYFAHLGSIKDLLSINQKDGPTYITQAISDVRGFESLVTEYPTGNNEKLTQLLLDDLDDNVARKNMILDHLIARFAEKFSDYAFLMKQIYGKSAIQIVLNTKKTFLNNYPSSGKNRGTAFNYYMQEAENLWNTANITGIENRIATLCGFKNRNRRNLSASLVQMGKVVLASENIEYQWNIKNLDGDIILSSNGGFPSTRHAENSLNKTILAIIETPRRLIEENLKTGISDGTIIGNFPILVSATGEFSFRITDKSSPHPHDIIGIGTTTYISEQTLKEGILNLVDFIVNDFTEEGIFVVEHILLRPDVTSEDVPPEQFIPICQDECTGCSPLDPYSFRVTIVLPGWTYRFSNPDFRSYLENLIRKELPAHILARICWPGYRETQKDDDENDIKIFENAFYNFLLHKTDLGQEQDNDSLTALINAISGLSSVYPSGTLMDCNDEEEDLKGRIILGQTNIGKL